MTVFSSQERYRLEREIKKGGMGDVWLATDMLLERPVAIKYPLITSTISIERLLQEARLLARLNHPNITTLYDFFVERGQNRFYLVMEYVDGKDLKDIIKGGPIPLDICLEIAQGVLHALSYAHAQGLVHRDIKPGNVMIADEVKLLDFGLANLEALLKQGTGLMAGTPAYIAPEQIEGRSTDGRADLYGLGVLLFEMLSGGRLPFEHTDVDEMYEAHLHELPPPLSQFVPDIPSALEQIILRLLAKDRADRYPSAEALQEALNSYDHPDGRTPSQVVQRAEPAPLRHNLPALVTPFIGREAELAGIGARLADPACRLLTLVGPGGSGKTRLAIEAGSAQIDSYDHGVFFVNLAPLQSVEAIVSRLAEACRFSFYEGDEPRQQLLDYLRQREMLFILDNFEHLLEGADLVTDILETAPAVKVLTTSRARLKLQGEQLFPVAGMDVPDEETIADAARYSAVKLFLSRVGLTQPGFEVSGEVLSDIARICYLVDGMPLGVLLAAGWVDLLTPAEIVTEISRNLDFLEADLHDLPDRQRSMRAVFDHSWQLLTGREQEVFQALSVFRGGFTRPAAQAVAGASLRDLMSLGNKSLLQRTPTGRYGIHDLLRQYAAEKLEASGTADVARNAHSAYYAEFLYRREEDLKGRRQLEALDEIEADSENVRAAWHWALRQKNYTAIGQSVRSLGYFCRYRSSDQEYRSLFRQAREQLAPDPDDEPHLVWGRILVAEFYARQGEGDKTLVERGLAVAQKNGAWETVVSGLHALGEADLDAGDYDGGLSFFEQSLAVCRRLNDDFLFAATLTRLAEAHRLLGQADQAIKSAKQSLELSRKSGDKYWAAKSLVNTGIIVLYTGNFTEAEGHLQEANTMYREMDNKLGIARSNLELSKLAFLKGNFAERRALAEEALEIATELGNKRIAQSALVGASEGAKDGPPVEQKIVPMSSIPSTIDRFEVKKVLGIGSSGSVYLAYDPENGRDVALKVAHPEALKKSDWLLRRFKNDAKIMPKLTHPAIAKCYGFSQTANWVFLVLEYIDGKDLEDALEEQGGSLPAQDVINWMVQVCDILSYMHSQKPEPLIFRDMKPRNVVVDYQGQVHLVDFGIAEPYRPGGELPMMGTVGYSPPEQYIGYSDVRSDIYALGATLHYLLTRRDPQKAKPFSFHDVPPRSLNPGISEELEAVVLKAVEYKAENRYQRAEEMKTALLACL